MYKLYICMIIITFYHGELKFIFIIKKCLISDTKIFFGFAENIIFGPQIFFTYFYYFEFLTFKFLVYI